PVSGSGSAWETFEPEPVPEAEPDVTATDPVPEPAGPVLFDQAGAPILAMPVEDDRRSRLYFRLAGAIAILSLLAVAAVGALVAYLVARDDDASDVDPTLPPPAVTTTVPDTTPATSAPTTTTTAATTTSSTSSTTSTTS